MLRYGNLSMCSYVQAGQKSKRLRVDSPKLQKPKLSQFSHSYLAVFVVAGGKGEDTLVPTLGLDNGADVRITFRFIKL